MAWVKILSLPFINCMTVGKQLDLSYFNFLIIEMGKMIIYDSKSKKPCNPYYCQEVDHVVAEPDLKRSVVTRGLLKTHTGDYLYILLQKYYLIMRDIYVPFYFSIFIFWPCTPWLVGS